MESNVEARNMGNGKTDPNYFQNSRYSYPNGSGSFAVRQNGSLPRKFHTNLPIRNDHYNYSHGECLSKFICIMSEICRW